MPLLTFLAIYGLVIAAWHLGGFDGDALSLSISTPVALLLASVFAGRVWHSGGAATPSQTLRFVAQALALASMAELLRLQAFVKLSSGWQPVAVELSHLRLVDAATLIVVWHAAVGGFVVMLGLWLARPRQR